MTDTNKEKSMITAQKMNEIAKQSTYKFLEDLTTSIIQKIQKAAENGEYSLKYSIRIEEASKIPWELTVCLLEEMKDLGFSINARKNQFINFNWENPDNPSINIM